METVTITISAQTLNTIGAALQEIAYKFAAPALKEIEAQVQIHLQEKQNAGPTGKNNPVGGSNGINDRVSDPDGPNYGKDQP